MEVRPGYKQTEVGVIPEEWEVETLRRLSRQSRLVGIADHCRCSTRYATTCPCPTVCATSTMMHLPTRMIGCHEDHRRLTTLAQSRAIV